jgi:hypothetical protein
MGGDMDDRREVVYGLSRDEARECLAQMLEERVKHQASHQTETEEAVVTYSQLNAAAPTSVQHMVTEILRRMAYGYSDQEAREGVLNELDELDEHWRAEHSDEPEPGDEYLRRVVAKVRQGRQ